MKAIWIFYCVPVWGPQAGGRLALVAWPVAVYCVTSSSFELLYYDSARSSMAGARSRYIDRL